MEIPISDFDRLKLDAPVLGAVERIRSGRRRFYVYCPYCCHSSAHILDED